MFEIISRAEAKARGLKKYFTGKQCRNGHLSEKYVESGCVDCVNDATARRRADPVKRKKETTASSARQAARRKSDPEWRERKNAENRARMNARYENDPEYRAKAKEKSSKQQSKPGYWEEQKQNRSKIRQGERERLQAEVATPMGLSIVARAEASTLRINRYFTAKPCEYGHVAERHTSNGTCVVCQASVAAARRAAKLSATPAWLTEQHHRRIEEYYVEAERLTRETGEPWEVDHIVPLLGRFITIDGARVREVCGLHVPWNLRVIPSQDNRSKSNKLLEAA